MRVDYSFTGRCVGVHLSAAQISPAAGGRRYTWSIHCTYLIPCNPRGVWETGWIIRPVQGFNESNDSELNWSR